MSEIINMCDISEIRTLSSLNCCLKAEQLILSFPLSLIELSRMLEA